ncbi:type III-B CRISPR module RAMP protein Cmr4 [Clostridium ihumii]|uniref:type III-B CRISPR module RAMP protein Cmr4 n=1 Tax=Clostridium ihumii TaxID=1470356 RepID=UPI003D35876D
MYRDKKIIYIKAITSIHAGTGQTIESVDMPIQREKHSNIPKIEASSLKGAIKHSLYNKLRCDKNNDENNYNELYTMLGPENADVNYASALGFTDVKLLFFPIKSVKNIFKLITCPYVLKMWIENVKFENSIDCEKINDIQLNLSEGSCINIDGECEILEEYVFENEGKIHGELLNLLENINGLDTQRIVILNDSDFVDMVTMYTEVITRNKINVETGTAADTGLFTEEYLPTESILYFTILASPSFDNENPKNSKDVIDYFNNQVDKVFQIGGNSTIGKGFVEMLGKVKENNNE